jgi:hypothetical protein
MGFEGKQSRKLWEVCLSHVKGSIIMTPAKCRKKICLSGGVHPTWTVGKNVTVKTSNFNKAQQLSTNGRQRIQYQSLKNLEFQ